MSAIRCGSVRGLGLGQQTDAFLVGAQHDLEQALGTVGRLLRQAADPPARRQSTIAVLERRSRPRSRGTRSILPAPLRPTRPTRAPVGMCARGLVEEHGGSPMRDQQVVDHEHGRYLAEQGAARQWQRSCCKRANRADKLGTQFDAIKEAAMCVPGCQEAIHHALSRHALSRRRVVAAAAAAFAATAVAPSPAGGAAAVQNGRRPHAHHVGGVSDLRRQRRASRCRRSSTSRRTATISTGGD